MMILNTENYQKPQCVANLGLKCPNSALFLSYGCKYYAYHNIIYRIPTEIIGPREFIRISTRTSADHFTQDNPKREDVRFLRTRIIIEQLWCNVIR